MSVAQNLSSTHDPLPDAYSIAIDQLDVSDPRLYKGDNWQPYFERLRNEDPVHLTSDSPFGSYWSITRYEDIVFVDSHPELFSSEPVIAIGDPPDDMPIEMFISMDGDKHTRQRKSVQGVVAPRNLAEMEPLIRSRAAQILDALPLGKPFNWVQDVSIELTSQMLTTLFDFPYEERHKLVFWSDTATSSPKITGGAGGDSKEAEDKRRAIMFECADEFLTLWRDKAARREAGEVAGFDLITMLQSNKETSNMIDKPLEFLGNIMLLLVGGNDTTRNSISGSVHALNQFPAEYDKLRNDIGLIPNMVSEIIRWQTPLIHMRRLATQDIELGGKTIRKGDKVVMWYVSGNRDERKIIEPNQFIIDREDARRHLSFGFGVHRCMGNRLAEMQLRILWEEIMLRFADIKVVGEPEYVQSNFVKGFADLQVIVTPL